MNNSRIPKVSVLIDTYNLSKFVGEAIESVINQDYPSENIEVIVVDDGSIDNTGEIVKKYEDVISNWVSEQDKVFMMP